MQLTSLPSCAIEKNREKLDIEESEERSATDPSISWFSFPGPSPSLSVHFLALSCAWNTIEWVAKRCSPSWSCIVLQSLSERDEVSKVHLRNQNRLCDGLQVFPLVHVYSWDCKSSCLVLYYSISSILFTLCLRSWSAWI